MADIRNQPAIIYTLHKAANCLCNIREICKLFSEQSAIVQKGVVFMEIFANRKTVYQKCCAKDNDNVICYVDCGVVLCR